MGVDELILGDDAVEGDAPALIVHAGDGVVGVGGSGERRYGGDGGQQPDAHMDLLPLF